MATIIISASDIQEHIDTHGLNITSVSWNEFNGPEVEYSINEDMEFEDDDLIDKEDYEQIQRDFDKLEKEHSDVLGVYEELVTKHETLEQDHTSLLSMYNEQNKMMAKKRFSLAFWK